MNMRQIEKLNEKKSAIEKMNMTHFSIMTKDTLVELAKNYNEGKVSATEMNQKLGKSMTNYVVKLANAKLN